MSKVDGSNLEQGIHLSHGFTPITHVLPCARSPTDLDAATGFAFLISSEVGFDTFASVNLVVMKNGEIAVWGSAEGYLVDTNGDWIAE